MKTTLNLLPLGQRQSLSRLLLQRLSRTPQRMLARCKQYQSFSLYEAFLFPLQYPPNRLQRMCIPWSKPCV